MWWPAIIMGTFMAIFGLVFVIRRNALAQSYAARREPLPRDHPQYRDAPAFTPKIFALLGAVAILAGLGGILLGIF